MGSVKRVPKLVLGVLTLCVLLAGAAFAADSIKGQVLGGGAPIAKSTVTFWEASTGVPKQLAQTKTSDDGRFEVRAKGASKDGILYLVATGGVPKASKASGDNPAIALLSVLTGYRQIIEVHLLFPHAMAVGEAHRLATLLEERLPQKLSVPAGVHRPTGC